MATSYTSLLGFALPVTGELDGTWGTVVNDNITKLVEDAIAATATNSVAAGDWTLTTTGSGAANQARCAIIRPTGTPGVSRNIIAPGQSKAYIVDNQSDAAVVFKASATTGVTIAAGKQALVAWNGSDFVQVGASAGGSNTQIQFNSSGALGGSANLTWDGSNVQIGAQGDLRFADSDSSNWVALQAPSTVASNVTFTLPSADGTSGQVLQTNGSGALSFSTVSSPAKASGALIVNTTTVSENYTVPTGSNAFSVGPITVSSGYAITVSSGQRWLVL
jgi:hypothetical protein